MILFVVGAVASGINAVAGGGTLLSFPVLQLRIGLESRVANATNSVALWPGSLSGAFGFRNLISKTKHHLRILLLPTFAGSIVGAELLVHTDKSVFDRVVPWLILFAAVLLLLQPKVKALVLRGGRKAHPVAAMAGQFFVAIYGGYFGAGMGIMMLAAFALYMDGTIHELNAVKNWLGLVINFTCSWVFIFQHLIEPMTAAVLALGSIVGGFAAARVSQKINPDKLRTAIAIYGIGMASFYLARAWGLI
ncbi:sulfite exporter TauE/SafE family protein [Fimbriimonas ginsengisoli]|uniref:Probable membrane transporter protein n=1 Tax=Fimbriimonas ginsengisoli Gsoil 348 TaxID=661478 RepID=A0A068NWV0_FIMGI|nr:sulfite exporter TauE/SafE family protein [Fimbriimonas ginsengisoli]AIE87993.1 hypothetical protein OP10G_4625 [Fimbriimonas ginsengisoli Gsoil 348]